MTGLKALTVNVFSSINYFKTILKTISGAFILLHSYQVMENSGGRGRQYKPPEDCFELPSKPIRLQDLPHPSELWLYSLSCIHSLTYLFAIFHVDDSCCEFYLQNCSY